MKVGVQLPEVEWEVPFPELIAMARLAETVGFDSVWLGDHLLYDLAVGPRGPWEVWTSLAAVAASTTTIELGPLVACTGFHAPAMLAKMAATVDAISGGRLILGLGAGWNVPDYRAFGFPYDNRVSRFEEAFTIIRTLLKTGECDFAGRYYKIEGGLLFPRPVYEGGIPLMLGSRGPKMLAAALPHVEMWNGWYEDWDNNLTSLTRLLAEIDAACETAGRDPKTLVRTICPLVRMTGGRGRISDFPGQSGDSPFDGADPVALAHELNAYAELGIGHVQLVIDPITAGSIAELKTVLDLLDA
jgi:alkanesulfonate monooxygenase SsuD/methylene tetrahydromethanopterin reductase-like flavin-dependent oxidoreductase (luciferase family)